MVRMGVGQRRALYTLTAVANGHGGIGNGQGYIGLKNGAGGSGVIGGAALVDRWYWQGIAGLVLIASISVLCI